MDSHGEEDFGKSRRSFLKKAGLGLVGVGAFVTVGGGLLRFRGRRRKQQMEFAKDSIFHPRDGGIGKA